MKVTLLEKEEKFKPITITLTIESLEDLVDLRQDVGKMSTSTTKGLYDLVKNIKDK